MTWTGIVRLDLARHRERTVAERQFCTGALKVMRPTVRPDSALPHWTLMNVGGGYVGGDRYAIDLRLGPGSHAVLDGQAATKIFRSEGTHALQRTEIRMGSGSHLVLRPQALIAYRGARYVQETTVTMASDSRLVSREIVTAGWSPDGQHFAFDSVRLRLRANLTSGNPLLIDNLLLEPRMLDPRSPLVLGDHTHLGTLVVISAGRIPQVAAVREICAAASEPDLRFGVGGIAGRTLVVRCLGNSTQSVERGLHAVESFCHSAD
ncbi:urease accessory protein UreD [Propionibacterium cyclohexanicum]|uniref:urease accessory protein UreD n=1 Tax=Propionibacterium cyclohexanicum TaxID=64702 RepID=UPI000B88E39B|nr:urease accessory protein UreD [Propionibacterium cyclohexanicum]